MTFSPDDKPDSCAERDDDREEAEDQQEVGLRLANGINGSERSAGEVAGWA
jgi:hypothetical protein